MTDGLDVDVRNVVVIGASAGGVQALISLFENLPFHVPAAFLAVLHIPAYEPSVLHKILSRATSMRVVAAQDGECIQQSTVYVAITDRHLMLMLMLMLMHEGIRLTRGPKGVFLNKAVEYFPLVVSMGRRLRVPPQIQVSIFCSKEISHDQKTRTASRLFR